MECVIFVGIQGSGKSAFFKERFADTHMRLNLDMLKTRARESRFFALCLETRQRCVIDNTNPAIADRAAYIAAARTNGFRVCGYFFDVPVADAMARNALRSDNRRIPVPGILATAKRLQPPQPAEGFDELWRVRVLEGKFVVEAMA